MSLYVEMKDTNVQEEPMDESFAPDALFTESSFSHANAAAPRSVLVCSRPPFYLSRCTDILIVICSSS